MKVYIGLFKSWGFGAQGSAFRVKGVFWLACSGSRLDGGFGGDKALEFSRACIGLRA